MCLCTVYGSHRVHLFKNQKHLFLYHQGFLQKLETTKKKKKSVSAVHSEAEMFCFSASCRLLTPTGLAVRATSGEAVSRWFMFFGPPPLKVAPAYTQQVISAHLALGSGSEQGPDKSAEMGTHLKFGTKS